MKAEAPYRIPMRLWSTVVSQLLIPVASWALLMFVSPGSAVRTEIMDEGGDLTLRQRARQFHQRSFLDGVGIMQPTREVLVIVDQHPGHQVVPGRDVRQVRPDQLGQLLGGRGSHRKTTDAAAGHERLLPGNVQRILC